MNTPSPVWGAILDHICLESPHPEILCDFYANVMQMQAQQLDGRTTLLEGPLRRLLVREGAAGHQPFAAWRLQGAQQLASLRDRLNRLGVRLEDSPTPLFQPGAIAVRDPDRRLAVFGLRTADKSETSSQRPGLAGRLQHVVVATDKLGDMHDFYAGLGFLLSDTVFTGKESEPKGDAHVRFLRTDIEHHSLAIFAASSSRHDHHCYETESWNDLRDWLDHLGQLDIAPWWGPGRHGPGNNLFFMFKDPDGNNVELSAELERITGVAPPRDWASSRRMYNLWGASWVRE